MKEYQLKDIKPPVEYQYKINYPGELNQSQLAAIEIKKYGPSNSRIVGAGSRKTLTLVYSRG